MDIFTDFGILSPYFYLFLIPLTVIYYTLGKKLRVQWGIVLLASLSFYFLNGGLAALWILAPILVTYFSTLKLESLSERKKSFLSAFVVVFNVVFLICFKELNFFIDLLNGLLLLLNKNEIPHVRINAPFGISYISLMLISYHLDSLWGTCQVQRNPLKFLAYTIFFPITTSGPIARYSEMNESLFGEHGFDYQNFCFGCQRIVFGLFKKMVIADRLAVFVNSVYGNQELGGAVVLLGLLMFTFQMYFDFSGCMDVVIGIGQCLGILIPENFTQPFFSRNLSEIWRRWHITLGVWVKDYVLYPILKSSLMQNFASALKKRLGKKNRYAKNLPTWCGMFAVWFTVGFWHGGSWNWIFGSGIFFFLMIVGGQLLQPIFDRLISFFRIDTGSKLWLWFERARTTLLFAMSISFDRAASLTEGFKMWGRVFSSWNPRFLFDGTMLSFGLDVHDWKVIGISVAIMIFIETMEQKENDESLLSASGKTSVRKILAGKNIVLRWILYLAMIFAVVIFGMYGPGYDSSSFIYGGF